MDEEVKEDLRVYQGDLHGGTCLVVMDDWSRAVLCIPTPGKRKAHLRFLAEQVTRFIGSLGYSGVIWKGDGEPSMRMLLEVVQQARQRLGFHTSLEISGPAEPKSNGRAEREIQTVRGLARTIVHGLKEGCQIQVKPKILRKGCSLWRKSSCQSEESKSQ